MTTCTTRERLQEFLDDTGEQTLPGAAFRNETARTLRVDLDGAVWLTPGAAIAYRGEVAFERLHTLGAGSLRDALTREAAPLVRASGRGRLYCGHRGAHAHVIRLAGERIVVAARTLLAFENTLGFEARVVSQGVGAASGGLIAVTLSGHGALALATHGRPLSLAVSPGDPVITDPHATLAWSAAITPSLKIDVGWRSAIGHGGGEPVQMRFDGTGFVVVQPYEEPGLVDLGPHPLRKVVALVSA